MANGNVFVERPEYTALALNYRNKALIADEVMPRITVGSEKFKWLSFPKSDRFTIPEAKLGRTSYANQVEFGGTEVEDLTKDYGLEHPVPNKDVRQFSETYDPLGRATEMVSELLALGREKRVADIVFNTNTFATANKTTLSGSSQWSDYSNSDPVDAILEALDGLLVRPNVAVFGRAVWTKLRKHPKVVSKVLGSVNSSGLVSAQALADALELDRIMVGASFLNSAKKGQTASYAEVWGKHAAFLYQSMASDMTFGFTAQYGARKMETFEDGRAGIEGTTIVRVTESVKEVTPATDLGYLFINASA